MILNLDKYLFPHDLPFDRRRKMAAVGWGVLFAILLVVAVTYLMLGVSGKFTRHSGSPRSVPSSDARIPGLNE